MSISPEVSTREPGSATGGAPARANHFILKRGTDMRVVGMVKQGSQKLKDRIEEPESSESTRRTSVFASLLTLSCRWDPLQTNRKSWKHASRG